MRIAERATDTLHAIAISPVPPSELKLLTKKKYSFNWKLTAKDFPLYKLTIEGQDEILGVMALENHRNDNRVEIKLIASSEENVGMTKKFSGIVECLFAFAAGEAVKLYGDLACISLLPKTELKTHYMTRYKMLPAGHQLFLEGKLLFDLAKKNLS